MAPELDREALRRQVEERQREGENEELEKAQQEARESFEALQDNLSGGGGEELQFADFRWRAGRPRIKEIEPADAVVPGAPLTISGEHLDRVRAVRIGGRSAESMALIDHRRLHVVVPRDAEDGRIELITEEPEPFEAIWDDDAYYREQKGA